MAEIKYIVSLRNPNAHLIQVRLFMDVAANGLLQLSLPAWIPGSYMIRDFAKNITEISAWQEGRQIELQQLDKQSWQLEVLAGRLEVSYEIFAYDLSVRSAHVDNSHAFFNGTSVFLKIEGYEKQAVQVEIAKPLDQNCSDWKLYTTLCKVEIDAAGFGTYSATDYEDLIDHPLECGIPLGIDFAASQIPHQLVLSGQLPRQINEQQLSDDLAKVCHEHQALFADGFPATEYKFLTLVSSGGYGGLEHKNSTALMCSPEDLPRKSDQQQTANYRKFLGLCSHEYFHLWNVKRIRPEKFVDLDLSQEVHTQLLWAFEGITSYYDDLALLRSGCIELKHYLEMLAQLITRYLRGRGRYRQNLLDSSFTAWTKFYKQDENAPNAIVSYYTKGALVALGLDMNMRRQSKGRICLDDLMRSLWRAYGKTGRGVPEDGVESLAISLAGGRLKEFFDQSLRSTDDLPISEWLAQLGIGMQLRSAANDSDQGGYIEKPCTDAERMQQRRASIGVLLKAGAALELQTVYKDSAAEQAGLAPGDEIIAINGVRAERKSFFSTIAALPIAEVADIHVFRRGSLQHFKVYPTAASDDVCDLYLLPETQCSQQQLQLRSNWMASNVAAPAAN
ncbi:MAG: PDZ domain-containing protein [Chromatiales bacterium]|jgi:predicted metalloprotease with PDZ domain